MHVLPDRLRPRLSAPLAPVLTTERAVAALRNAPCVVSVGDVVTLMCLDHGILPRVACVDFKTKRGPPGFPELRAKLAAASIETRRVTNPAATITDDLWRAIERALRGSRPVAIEVVGEEDLAVLPALALAPAHAAVVYGQPGKGAVVLTVTDATRELARGILHDMDVT